MSEFQESSSIRKCPKCGYERTQKDDSFISVSECPKCGVIYKKELDYIAKRREMTEEKHHDAPKPTAESVEDNNSTSIKKCPYCAEEIRFDALKCRYCGEWLNQQSVKRAESSVKNEVSDTENEKFKESQKYYNQGCRKFDNGDYHGAIEEFDKAINLNPQYTKAYTNRGIAYKKVGVDYLAEQDLKIAEKMGSKIAIEYLGSFKYAGFGIRFGSGLIDFIILLIPSTLAIALEREVLGEFGGIIILTIVWWLYYALLESSERQASIGKKALGLIVIDSEGRKITFWRATSRFFISLISALIYGIGYIMIAFNKKKQGLHDWMTDTFVLKTDSSYQYQENSENIMNFVQSTKLAQQKVTYGKNIKRPLIVVGSIVVILIIIGIISGLMEQQNQGILQEKSQRLQAEQQRNAMIAAEQARIMAEQRAEQRREALPPTEFDINDPLKDLRRSNRNVFRDSRDEAYWATRDAIRDEQQNRMNRR